MWELIRDAQVTPKEIEEEEELEERHPSLKEFD